MKNNPLKCLIILIVINSGHSALFSWPSWLPKPEIEIYHGGQEGWGDEQGQTQKQQVTDLNGMGNGAAGWGSGGNNAVVWKSNSNKQIQNAKQMPTRTRNSNKNGFRDVQNAIDNFLRTLKPQLTSQKQAAAGKQQHGSSNQDGGDFQGPNKGSHNGNHGWGWSGSEQSSSLSVDFYYGENFRGMPRRLSVEKDTCSNVPKNFLIHKPLSVISSGCIKAFSKPFCLGHGVRMAGHVGQLQSSGLNWGVGSIRACEDNIKISFDG